MPEANKIKKDEVMVDLDKKNQKKKKRTMKN